ncbi:Uncharacterized protein TCM_023443 [Theobroma cacao]|uniref:DUF7745 domain-containing protein n=1 Tax=Theobroma cacao TaxID=3641 RepID=A0A061F294_THECC|nr:Uncharacterized protein TCM_023443 [Theobroma cacao]
MGEDRGALLVQVDDSEEQFGNLLLCQMQTQHTEYREEPFSRKHIFHLTTIDGENPIAFMESSWPLLGYDGIYELTQHVASPQLREGDCLAKGHISSLPNRVYLDLKQNNFTYLLNIWERWRSMTRGNFDKRYGHIARLLKVQIDDQLLKAIVQFWDPSYRCFVLNEVDMVPTIEEYSTLLQIDLDNHDKIFWKGQKIGHRQKLAKMMGTTLEEVNQHLRKKGNNECIPWSFLRSYIMKHQDTEQGMISYAPFMVRRQFRSEQFVLMTYRLNTLEFAYGELGFLKTIKEIARVWKKTSQVNQGRYTDEVTIRWFSKIKSLRSLLSIIDVAVTDYKQDSTSTPLLRCLTQEYPRTQLNLGL